MEALEESDKDLLESLETITDSKPIIVAFGLATIMNDQQSKIPARQAIWNLRDVLSRTGAILIMTAPMGWINPFPDDIAVVQRTADHNDWNMVSVGGFAEFLQYLQPGYPWQMHVQ